MTLPPNHRSIVSSCASTTLLQFTCAGHLPDTRMRPPHAARTPHQCHYSRLTGPATYLLHLPRCSLHCEHQFTPVPRSPASPNDEATRQPRQLAEHATPCLHWLYTCRRTPAARCTPAARDTPAAAATRPPPDTHPPPRRNTIVHRPCATAPLPVA